MSVYDERCKHGTLVSECERCPREAALQELSDIGQYQELAEENAQLKAEIRQLKFHVALITGREEGTMDEGAAHNCRLELETAMSCMPEALVERYVEATRDGQAWSQALYFSTLALWHKLDSIEDLLREKR